MNSVEGTSSMSTLNLMNKAKSSEKNSNRGYSGSKSMSNKDKNKYRKKTQYFNYDKIGHLKRNYKVVRRSNNKNQVIIVTGKVHQGLLLSINSPIDFWVLDFGV